MVSGTCPHCGDPGPHPFVSADHSTHEVTYECMTCHNETTVEDI